MKDKMPIIFVLLAGVLWGTTGTAQTFAPEGALPVTVGAIRMAVGGVTLLLFATIQGKLNLKNWPWKTTVIAAGSIAAFQPLFFSAVAITGVAVGTVVAIGSSPVLAGILEGVFWRKIPEKKWWVSTLLAIIGCVLLFSSNNQEITISPIGIVMALGAGLGFAIYTLFSKQLLQNHATEAVTAVVFTLSGLFLAPLLIIYDTSWLLEFRGIAVALHLGVIATAAAYLLFVQGLIGVSASTALTLILAEPLTAAILGVFIVGEELTLLAWFGVALLLLGLGLLSYTPKKIAVEEVN
ncbi:MAG: EamA family transporter [Clostridiaceae bacterium]|nr:EamA family transporter [Clostridiaceae bacterium]